MKLHGVQISNYYSMVKIALMEKGISFEEVLTPPSQDPNFLAISPMGKIPVLETEGRFLSESQAIIGYLETVKKDPPLFPEDPWLAAQAQQIHMILDLYVDGGARPLLGAAFFGKAYEEADLKTTQARVDQAVAALRRISEFQGFAVGERLTHADIAAFCNVPLAVSILERLGGEDPLRDWPEFRAYLSGLESRPAFRAAGEARGIAVQKMFAGS